ncbi:hypothetical protein [Bacillus marasmi]|uniref:hypothetical protein n=1 Tax=Bacillus marasmi TaxID=1926279 RepID=UPI0011C7726C|nr:hypothetical protein [Bacillus marasmi]
MLERTDEHHFRFREKLEFIENELTNLKQNNEIKSLKNDMTQKELPSITIDHITIENVHIVTSEIPAQFFQLHRKSHGESNQQVSLSPKINFRKKS